MSNHQAPSLSGFTHLHVHSHYTLLGSMASVDDLVSQAISDGLTHLALTDTNALYGLVAFDRACRHDGLEPILGMTVTMAPLPGTMASSAEETGLLVLLAMNNAGYGSLCRLSSHIQGSADRLERAARGLAWEDLKHQSEGLICLSGGRRGWIERCLRAEDYSAATGYARRLEGIFGDRAYLALEWHRPGDQEVLEQIDNLARRLGLPTVAVQPVYCLSPGDRSGLRLLAAIDRNCQLTEVPVTALHDGGDSSVTLHWLPASEVARRLKGFPEAVANVAGILSRCGPALPDGRPIWPALKLPPGQTADQALDHEATRGLLKRYGDTPAPAVQRRMLGELTAIAQHGFSPLFLMVADIVDFARENDIPVSTRGSVANSLVAYCTGITTVDPVEHDLLFERFLSPARLDPPDIDLDFCSRRRDRVLEYVRETYGSDRVALVATVSTMRLKGAVRAVGKAYGLDEATIGRLVRRLPSRWHPDPRRRSRTSVTDILQELEDPKQREVVGRAAMLEGQPDHLSVHPGGIVVTPGPLTDVVPVQWTAKGFLITQFDHADVEFIGLPKIDLLGIRALTVLADAADLVRHDQKPTFRLSNLPLSDPKTGDLLARGETIGVFQCESAGAQRTLRQLKARTIRDLAVANAFFKPGPATGGMARAFVRRYRGEEPVSFLHPALEPILEHTKGVLIFQEQILRVATEIAGLSWEQADHLRRGMSKFQAEEMEQLRTAFLDGCMKAQPQGPGFARPQAETLWEQVVAFAGYGFNQGHATAYADVSYRSAYLKAHWPADFMCARLGDWGGYHHQAIYIAEAQRLGITVKPPHINYSGRKFTLTWEGKGPPQQGLVIDGEDSSPMPPGPDQVRQQATLWMGLGQVRDLRQSSVQAIVDERHRRAYSGLRDLLARVALHPKEVVHLIRCGALDGLDLSRAALHAEWLAIERAGSTYQMGFDFAHDVEVMPETPAERLAWEQQLLGLPLSTTPLAVADIPQTVPLRQLAERPGRPARVAAYRLPGWTGGPGFFAGDGTTYVTAVLAGGLEAPVAWQPFLAWGYWRVNEWGTEWMEVEGWEPLHEQRHATI